MIFGLISTLFQYTFIGAFAIAGMAGGFAYYTKPSDEMLRNKITSNMGQSAMYKLIGKEEIADWFFAKTATITIGTQQQKYIGYLNNWYPIK